MRVGLLHPVTYEGSNAGPTLDATTLTDDLELATVWATMADGDGFLLDVARHSLLHPLIDPQVIAHRQRAVVDALHNPAVIREIYNIAVTAVTDEQKHYFGLSRDTPDTTLSNGIILLERLLPMLEQLRVVADSHGTGFDSPAFTEFFSMLQRELNDDYLDEVETHLRNLQPRRGVDLAAEVGRIRESTEYLVLRPRKSGWRNRMPPVLNRSQYSFQIPSLDNPSVKALSSMRRRGINEVANALAQSADYVRDFFRTLRAEIAFYVGCLNLAEQLAAREEPICIPEAVTGPNRAFSATGLYNVSLSLHLQDRAIGNDVVADGKRIVFITGANQGGKSTFLRSVGQAQLMMQAGMFVAAGSLRAGVVPGMFTHCEREEDATMERGKLEEELDRMSAIADTIGPGALLLCNESFSSTNEREGSAIARQLVKAMTECGINVMYVTHLYDLAHSFEKDEEDQVLFLRAERLPDGTRSFLLHQAAPLDTSFGADLYREIFIGG